MVKGKGVRVKKEDDGRMFPESDSSATIINCFLSAMSKSGIQLHTSTRATKWSFDTERKMWKTTLFDGSMLYSKFLLIATGSDQRTWDTLAEIGHKIIPPVPSLFTFNIKDKNLTALPGISRLM